MCLEGSVHSMYMTRAVDCGRACMNFGMLDNLWCKLIPWQGELKVIYKAEITSLFDVEGVVQHVTCMTGTCQGGKWFVWKLIQQANTPVRRLS